MTSSIPPAEESPLHNYCPKTLCRMCFKYWSTELHKNAYEEHYESKKIGGPLLLWVIDCNETTGVVALQVGKPSCKIPPGFLPLGLCSKTLAQANASSGGWHKASF